MRKVNLIQKAHSLGENEPDRRKWGKEAGKSIRQGTSNRESGITEQVKAPWEIDGRKWHTHDRVAGNGSPAHWEGRILERVIDQVKSLDESRAGSDTGFAPADWSQRNVVRINGSDGTKVGFPFFHATTSSEWVVTLRFFVPKNTFRLRVLESQLGLLAFRQSATPVLCDQPRLKINDLGPFQEITIVGHTAKELDTPGFDAFLRKAVRAFLDIGKPSKLKKASDLD